MTSTLTYAHPKHHETCAKHNRTCAEAYRSYLTWATDPALIAWATGMARSAQLAADTEDAYAAAIRAHQAGAA